MCESGIHRTAAQNSLGEMLGIKFPERKFNFLDFPRILPYLNLPISPRESRKYLQNQVSNWENG